MATIVERALQARAETRERLRLEGEGLTAQAVQAAKEALELTLDCRVIFVKADQFAAFNWEVQFALDGLTFSVYVQAGLMAASRFSCECRYNGSIFRDLAGLGYLLEMETELPLELGQAA